MSSCSGYTVVTPKHLLLVRQLEDLPTVLGVVQGVLVFHNGILETCPDGYRIEHKQIIFVGGLVPGAYVRLFSSRGSDLFKVERLPGTPSE